MMTTFLIVMSFVILMAIIYLMLKLQQIKSKEKEILVVLEDIENGNLKRRILATNTGLTDEICYKINHIVKQYEEQLLQMNITEKTNGQIMTSLAHDVRTPLTTLIGYLDAIIDETVTGEERERYILIAQSKAYALKNYTDDLFEWFKINSKERPYHFEVIDINELSRNILTEWIPEFEDLGLNYHIEIASSELYVSLDVSAYGRILNNLIHNVVKHSNGKSINITIKNSTEHVQITISDDGKGISEKDLPYVFQRLYTADTSRPIGSSGLGLSIVHELIKAHDADISAESIPNIKTVFSISMKKVR